VTEYRLVAEPRVDRDVAATYQWYESEQRGLGLEFLPRESGSGRVAAATRLASGWWTTRLTARRQ